ncbi:MAG: M24 family metallopeptidase [Planctomycetes bacterium]|nr:M24 family metallopeptidase [Planctomycetota bacterium]
MTLPADAQLDTHRLRARLATLRLVKSTYEVECLQAAISITCAALREAFAHVRPGAFEYEPQGALEGAFRRLGGDRAGFASIVGSGPNSVTLHYSSNQRQMQDGELLVMDVGAKYRYYCADVTRTLPVGGRFTPRQRQVYEAVLAAQRAAEAAAQPGVTMAELDGIARRVITDAGFGPAFRYFKHGLGHWIGLDVHDVGGQVPILPGMTFTIEPGIYIDAEDLGVRIEDDYLMTVSGAVKLSGAVPSDPDDIEALLRG